MKKADLTTYQKEGVGTVDGFYKNNEHWFLASSLCRELGLKDAGRQVKAIEERFKIAEVKGSHTMRPLVETAGGKQPMLFVSESVMYELIFQSRKQKAIKFRTWVTTELLPELREKGFYRTEGKKLRLNLTDNIKKSVENKSDNTKKFAYSNYSRLINKSLGLESRVNRDMLDAETLEKVAHRENLVSALLAEGKEFFEIKNFIEELKGE